MAENHKQIFVNLGTLGKDHQSDSSIDKSIHSHKFRKYFRDVVVATIYLCTEAFNLIWCLSRFASTNSICNLFDKKFHHLFMACLLEFRCNHWENQTNFIYWRRKITQWHEIKRNSICDVFITCFHLKLDFSSISYFAFSADEIIPIFVVRK